MADTVSTKVDVNTKRRYVANFYNSSDGTGESTVTKVDISTLQGSPSKVKITEIWFALSGMQVIIYYNNDSNLVAGVLALTGYFDFRNDAGGGNVNTGSGGTGDILFSTISASVNDSYWIRLALEF